MKVDRVQTSLIMKSTGEIEKEEGSREDTKEG